MSDVYPSPSCIVILFDPSDTHFTLEEDRYSVFYRFTTFNEALNLIETCQFAQIDLHVPIDFDFNFMRQHPEVYIHTYFMDDEEISDMNVTERQKIRDSIRRCCEVAGEDFVQRGVMEWNDHTFEEGINLAEQLLLLNINRSN